MSSSLGEDQGIKLPSTFNSDFRQFLTVSAWCNDKNTVSVENVMSLFGYCDLLNSLHPSTFAKASTVSFTFGTPLNEFARHFEDSVQDSQQIVSLLSQGPQPTYPVAPLSADTRARKPIRSQYARHPGHLLRRVDRFASIVLVHAIQRTVPIQLTYLIRYSVATRKLYLYG